MLPDENEGRGHLSVVEGVLETVCSADGSAQTLPATRRLDDEALHEVDRQEGLSIDVSSIVRPEGVHRHSLYEILFGVLVLVAVFAACFQIVPLRRLVSLRLEETLPSFSSAVVAAEEKAIPFIGKGSKLDEVVGEIGRLVDRRQYAEVLALCRRALKEIGDDKEKNRAWGRVWAAYLETLVLTRMRHELMSGCRRLSKIDPDSDVALYYRARHALLEIESYDSVGSIEPGLREVYQQTLKTLEHGCELRLRVGGVVSKGQDLARGDSRLDAKAQRFGLVLAELRLQRWILEGRRTDAPGVKVLSSALSVLKRLPESREAVSLELRAWEELGTVCHVWHSLSMFSIEVCGEQINRKWIAQRTSVLREKLSQGGLK